VESIAMALVMVVPVTVKTRAGLSNDHQSRSMLAALWRLQVGLSNDLCPILVNYVIFTYV